MIHLCVVLTAGLCSIVAAPIKPDKLVIVLEGSTVELPCLSPKSDQVTWSLLRGGAKVILFPVKDGQNTDNHFKLQENKSLLIMNVTPEDERMYLCDEKHVYLRVNKSKSVKETEDSVTPGLTDLDPGPAAGDAEDEPSELWKVPVGIVIGAALVLMAVAALKFLSTTRAKTKSTDKPAAEVVYEEIQDVGREPGKDPDEDGLHYCSITQQVYSSENKARRSNNQEVVYSLVQNPAQAGNSG